MARAGRSRQGKGKQLEAIVSGRVAKWEKGTHMDIHTHSLSLLCFDRDSE